MYWAQKNNKKKKIKLTNNAQIVSMCAKINTFLISFNLKKKREIFLLNFVYGEAGKLNSTIIDDSNQVINCFSFFLFKCKKNNLV